MISIQDLSEGLPIFKALSSGLRVQILQLILSQEGIHFRQIAQNLHIPASTVAPHIRMLEECQLIHVIEQPNASGYGTKKCCYPAKAGHISISLSPHQAAYIYRAEIPIGHYTDFSVLPTCGLASSSAFIGQMDEPRYFAHPLRYQAEILWFGSGYIEYTLPNFIPAGSRVNALKLSFEIASEAPRHNNCWPSDITFSLNGTDLGVWTSPGDFGDRPGLLNPGWWFDFMNQYGLLKTLSITREGTFLDGSRLSEVSIDSLQLTWESILRFRFTAAPSSFGGCTLYGRSFGDAPQNLRLEISYS